MGIPDMQKDFNALQKCISANIVTNLDTSLVFAARNKSHTRRNQGHIKHINCPVVDYIHLKVPYLTNPVILHLVKMNHSVYR